MKQLLVPTFNANDLMPPMTHDHKLILFIFLMETEMIYLLFSPCHLQININNMFVDFDRRRNLIRYYKTLYDEERF